MSDGKQATDPFEKQGTEKVNFRVQGKKLIHFATFRLDVFGQLVNHYPKQKVEWIILAFISDPGSCL